LLCAKEVTSKLSPCKSFMAIVGSLQLNCGVVVQPPCKGFGRRLQYHRLVNHELAFVACSPENRVSHCVVGGLYVGTHSNIDVLPLTMKELREYILMSPVSPLWLFSTFTFESYLLLLVCFLITLGKFI
jgi:hypothetical protein